MFLRYLWSFFAGLGLFVITAMGCVLVLISALTLPDLKKVGNLILSVWARLACAFLGVRLRVEGLENLPQGGCLFLFNHTSLMDIPIFHAAIKKPARFGAKAELFKIPLFGWTMRRMGALKINRGDRDRVLQLYKESVRRVHAGHSFILAAEGTRMMHPGVGEKFKSGPFIFAISGQFPIVPLVIKGGYELLPKSALFPQPGALGSEVVVRVLPPMPTEGLSIDDRQSLKKKVRLEMTNAYAQS
jgi:1-acyl-sn-glycerol-3-phosphate acyltransferase